MDNTTHHHPIPAYMDAEFVRNQAGIVQPWGRGPTDDPAWQIVVFDASKLDEVIAVVAAYDSALLTVRKSEKAKALAEARWNRSLVFKYDGVWTNADPAMAVVLGKLEMRKRGGVPPEEKQTWKLNDFAFRKWDENETEAFGFGIGNHLQNCFNNEERLSDLIEAAATLAELDAIDLNSGWPEYA